MIDVALVLATHNHAQSIVECLTALQQLDPAPAELVVIDQASQDHTVDLIRQHFPEIRLIEVRANLGLAGGYNWGARITTASTLVFLNPYIIPRHDWLQQLVHPFQWTGGIGVVGCKLLLPHTQRVYHAGGSLNMPLALTTHRGINQVDYGQYDALESVEFVSSAAFAIRRDVWNHVQGMDEAFYPAAYEDVDLCTRVRQAGWTVVYTPCAVVQYQVTPPTTAQMLRLVHLNRLRYVFKHFNNVWLMRAWMPAEMSYLRGLIDTQEISSLQLAYLTWQMYFSGHERNPTVNSLDLLTEHTEQTQLSELQWNLRQIEDRLGEAPPPLRLRWSPFKRLSQFVFKHALKYLTEQQHDVNRSIHDVLRVLVRQRRAADAAVLLQGMLLAKVLQQQQEGSGS